MQAGLDIEIQLEGSSRLSLENRTGRRESEWPFQGTLRGVMEVGLDADGQQIVARVALPDAWSAALSVDELPTGFSAMFSQALSELARPALGHPELPELPLLALGELGLAKLNGLRVRPADAGVAVDFHFPIPVAGAVGALPDPGEGWVAVLPETTALGLMQAVALTTPYDPEQPVVPEYVGLSLDDDRFVLDVLAWPTRAPTLAGRPLGERGPRPVRVEGRVGLSEAGELEVVTESADWGTEGGRAPDLAALLLGRRALDQLVAAAQATMPAQAEQELAGVALVAEAERAAAQDGALRIEGSMRAATSAP